MVRDARSAVAMVCMVGVALLVPACASETSSPGANGEFLRQPYESGTEVGNSYGYQLYTHCGVHWARIDGRFWETFPLNDGNANPPDGWGNPYQAGKIVLESTDSARFEGAGHELQFVPSAGEPPMCE
jgi:hypothetical protein